MTHSNVRDFVGTFCIKNKTKRLNDRLFNALENFINSFRYISIGPGHALFCSREIFYKTNGFDTALHVFEDGIFKKRAVSNGARYILINSFVATSTRRYRALGYWRNFIFYLKNSTRLLFGKTPERPEPIR